jgi:GGDEF domain-containing protein
MEAPSLSILPAATGDRLSVAVTGRALDRVDQRAAALYAVWASIAWIAHGAGAVPLPAGAGLVLSVGVAMTLALFVGLGRLPVAEQPAGATLVTAQSLMGIVWSTLYAWYAVASAGGAVLSVGMCLSAIALAVPAASLPVLGRLMFAAALASISMPLLHQAVLVESGAGINGLGLLQSMLASLVLSVLLGAVYLAARTLASARDQLQARNAELEAGIERVMRRAERDHLTNSYNRQSILEMVGREKSRADRSGQVLCVCLLDIDHFKTMNDRYGHQAGDRILAAFSRRVRGALRTMDTVNTGVLPVGPGEAQGEPVPPGRSAFGRVGGEEFIVLLPETSLRGALRCAERVRQAVVRRPFDGLHHVTVSIGIAEYRPGETVSSLIGRADEALYGAKHAGRNRVHCATTDGGPNAIVMPSFLEATLKGTGP